MFVCNLKVNSNKILKCIFVLVILVILGIFGFSVYRIIGNAKEHSSQNSCIPAPEIYDISNIHYTNILKAVHDDLDTYIGQKIHFTGYVYRVIDLEQTQFVLARDMIISSDFQTVVVGFLCNSKNALDFPDGTWVDVVGKITKGNYHGEIPVIEITNIKQTRKTK